MCVRKLGALRCRYLSNMHTLLAQCPGLGPSSSLYPRAARSFVTVSGLGPSSSLCPGLGPSSSLCLLAQCPGLGRAPEGVVVRSPQGDCSGGAASARSVSAVPAWAAWRFPGCASQGCVSPIWIGPATVCPQEGVAKSSLCCLQSSTLYCAAARAGPLNLSTRVAPPDLDRPCIARGRVHALRWRGPGRRDTLLDTGVARRLTDRKCLCVPMCHRYLRLPRRPEARTTRGRWPQ